jgi:putative addiction module component (TIGR02574 family)
MKPKIVRVQRQTRLSPAEAAAITKVRNQIADELPAIKARARALLAEQQAELQRRIAAHERSPEQVLTWEEVLDRLRDSR